MTISSVEKYLIDLGYKHTERKSLLASLDEFSKGDIRIEYDVLFESIFRIYKNGEEVFDIDKTTRKVFPTKNGSNEYVRSKGIIHHIGLAEVKCALRKLNIDILLDE